jgi:thiol:disulfide interchange protein DsbD
MLAAFTFHPAAAQEKQSIFDISDTSLFSNDDEFLNVGEAFSFNFYQKDNQLEVSFDIAPGYYLYRHQFKFKGKDINFTPVLLPGGIDHEDEFFGIQKIFTEQLSFIINLGQVSSNGSIKITYQGCAEKGLCYPPTSKVIELSKLVASESITNDSTLSTLSLSDSLKPNQVDVPKSEQHQLSDMLKQDSLLS